MAVLDPTPVDAVHRSPTPHDFDALVLPHLDALHAVARGIVSSDDLAWDAVQEALLCLWRESERPADLRPWLVRTVVHKSLHVDRARSRRIAHEDRAGVERLEPCPFCHPVDPFAGDELDGELEAALDSLSEEFRAVLVLRARDGLEYAEIAAALSLPIGTVRSRLRRARDRIAERLGFDVEDGAGVFRRSSGTRARSEGMRSAGIGA